MCKFLVLSVNLARASCLCTELLGINSLDFVKRPLDFKRLLGLPCPLSSTEPVNPSVAGHDLENQLAERESLQTPCPGRRPIPWR